MKPHTKKELIPDFFRLSTAQSWCTLKFLIVGVGGGGDKLHFSEILHTHFHLLTPSPPNYVFHAKSHPPHFRKTKANLP